MRKLIYSMGVSLDGFIAGPGGDIEWTAPDDELHRFHNEQVTEIGEHFLGRRLYETMVYWETALEDPSIGATEREFAGIWQALPKVVYSRTLEAVEGNTRLAREVVAEEIEELKRQPGKDLAVGGAGLAATFTELGLIDAYLMFVYPVALGAGTPYLPAVKQPLSLELIETRRFGSVVYLRYERP